MSITRLFERRTTTVSIYRPPAIAGGKRGDAVLLASDVIAKRWPATSAPSVLAAVPALAGSRVAHVIAFKVTIDVSAGDEIHEGSRIYKVEGVGTWRTVRIAGCSEVVPR